MSKPWVAEWPKGLLFDLDGTLLDSVPDLAIAVDGMLLAASLPPAGEERVRSWVGNGAKRLVARALADAQNCDENAIDESELLASHQQFLHRYRDCSGQYSRLYDGVLPALQNWHRQGRKMALVTNKPAEFITPILERFGLSEFFELAIGGDSLPNQKPHPEPLLIACQGLGLAVEDCLMIGDSRNDVDAARAANMPVVCVSYGYNHGQSIEQSTPDQIVDSLLVLG